MKEENKAKLQEQVKKIPDYDVVWLWQLAQRELEQRDENWPKAKGWRAVKFKEINNVNENAIS